MSCRLFVRVCLSSYALGELCFLNLSFKSFYISSVVLAYLTLFLISFSIVVFSYPLIIASYLIQIIYSTTIVYGFLAVMSIIDHLLKPIKIVVVGESFTYVHFSGIIRSVDVVW